MGFLKPDVGHGGRNRQARLSPRLKAVTVHCLAHAVAAVAAAVEAGRPVLLLSAPCAAGYAGPAWFAAMATEAGRAFADAEIMPVLDCGDRTGHALAALRYGLAGIRYKGTASERVRALAECHGAVLFDERPPSLDLAEYDGDGPALWQATCRDWLST